MTLWKCLVGSDGEILRVHVCDVASGGRHHTVVITDMGLSFAFGSNLHVGDAGLGPSKQEVSQLTNYLLLQFSL